MKTLSVNSLFFFLFWNKLQRARPRQLFYGTNATLIKLDMKAHTRPLSHLSAGAVLGQLSLVGNAPGGCCQQLVP